MQAIDTEPLTIRVTSSPINVTELSVNELTPIKSTSLSTSNTNGLLAYSTPNFIENRYKFLTPILTKSESYTPKVNFHSIDDIVGSSSKCEEADQSSGYASNDSGVMSFYNQNLIQNLGQHLNQNCSKDESTPDENDENKENVKVSNNNADNKKIRTTFTDHQKQQLDIYFHKNPYPDPRELEDLTRQLDLPEAVIKVWFQNKRSRDKQRKFSHSSRAAMRQAAKMKESLINNSSPLVANLQMLSSRINSTYYAAALTAALQNQNTYKQFY
jgi:hypothetical protein